MDVHQCSVLVERMRASVICWDAHMAAIINRKRSELVAGRARRGASFRPDGVPVTSANESGGRTDIAR